MDASVKKSPDKPTSPKGGQAITTKPAKDQAVLDRISETRRKCGDGVKMLPVLRYRQKLWFLDERLRQLRNVGTPHDFINLDEFEVEYFRRKVI